MNSKVYKSTSLQVYGFSKKPLLTLTLALLIASCSGEVENAPAVSAPTVSKTTKSLDTSEADELTRNFFSKIPPAIQNSYWPRNGYIPAENLIITGDADYETSSAGSSPKSGLAITSTPIIAEDKIFTLGGGGELQARSINDISEVLWETKIESISKDGDGYISQAKTLFDGKSDFIGGNICYSLGNVFVATKRGSLFAVSTDSGNIIWQKNYGISIRSTPIVRDGKILFITADNRTITVDAKNGEKLWEHAGLAEKSKVMSAPAPLLLEDKVIVTYSSGEIFALNFNDGTELWVAEASKSPYAALSAFMNDISQSPVEYNGLIYVVASDGTLNAMDNDGKTVWSFEGDVINSGVWGVGDFLFTKTRFGDLLAISAREGKLVWRAKMADAAEIDENELSFTGVIMANNRLYTADNNGTLYSYSPKNGAILNKTSIPDAVVLSPVVANGHIFFLTKDSTLIEVR